MTTQDDAQLRFKELMAEVFTLVNGGLVLDQRLLGSVPTELNQAIRQQVGGEWFGSLTETGRAMMEQGGRFAGIGDWNAKAEMMVRYALRIRALCDELSHRNTLSHSPTSLDVISRVSELRIDWLLLKGMVIAAVTGPAASRLTQALLARRDHDTYEIAEALRDGDRYLQRLSDSSYHDWTEGPLDKLDVDGVRRQFIDNIGESRRAQLTATPPT